MPLISKAHSERQGSRLKSLIFYLLGKSYQRLFILSTDVKVSSNTKKLRYKQMEIFHQCFQYTAFLFDFIECYFLLQSMQHFLQIMFKCLYLIFLRLTKPLLGLSLTRTNFSDG